MAVELVIARRGREDSMRRGRCGAIDAPAVVGRHHTTQGGFQWMQRIARVEKKRGMCVPLVCDDVEGWSCGLWLFAGRRYWWC